ncbi:MAG TPA: hypothetical protein VLA90_11295 [Actinomycetota bacterium]|nr:hypothetical protein [Actinomycetota bacterium]
MSNEMSNEMPPTPSEIGTRTRADADVERAPEIAELGLAPRPEGPAAAAILAAGIGMFALGLLTILNEASEGLHDWLEGWEFGRGVGPLAGKTTVAVIVWVVAWIALGLAWRRKDVNLKTWFWVAFVLGALGFVGTFPPVFEAFAAE